MRIGLDGIRAGIYAGHKRGQLFTDGCDVWRCDASSERKNYETSTLMARFRLRRDATAWVKEQSK